MRQIAEAREKMDSKKREISDKIQQDQDNLTSLFRTEKTVAQEKQNMLKKEPTIMVANVVKFESRDKVRLMRLEAVKKMKEYSRAQFETNMIHKFIIDEILKKAVMNKVYDHIWKKEKLLHEEEQAL